MLPKKISISDSDDLVIDWSDGETSSINIYLLRKSCPCALCKVERDKNHHDYNLFRGEKTEIIDISVVGQHALKITWKDGHSEGMYEFQYLVDLAKKGYSTIA